MGQERRALIFRLTNLMSRKELQDLITKIRPKEYLCYKCGKNCGNAGMLAKHMKSPGIVYRDKHKIYDQEQGVKNERYS
jgi:hypothetical protein